MKKWLTIQEASTYLNRCTRQIYRYINDGRLKGYQTGGYHCKWLFDVRDLDAFVMHNNWYSKLNKAQKRNLQESQ